MCRQACCLSSRQTANPNSITRPNPSWSKQCSLNAITNTFFKIYFWLWNNIQEINLRNIILTYMAQLLKILKEFWLAILITTYYMHVLCESNQCANLMAKLGAHKTTYLFYMKWPPLRYVLHYLLISSLRYFWSCSYFVFFSSSFVISSLVPKKIILSLGTIFVNDVSKTKS